MKMTTSSRPKGDILYLLTLSVATLSTALSIAILGTVAHSYYIYQQQKAMNNPWWLPLWPGHFSVAGTKALIGAGAGIALLNGIFLGGRVVEKFHRPTFKALSTLVVSTASILLALFGLILTHVLNSRTNNTDTIQTWTCRFNEALPAVMMTLGDGKSDAREMSNGKFGLLCTESRFGFWGMVVLCLLQVLMVAFAVGEWVVGRKVVSEQAIETEGDMKTEFSL